MSLRLKNCIIDADYIIYIATAKAKLYGEDGLPLKDEKGRFVYRDITLEEALTKCDSYINDLLHNVGASYFLLCLTTGRNFRYAIEGSYKANRTDSERPMWFSEVKQHLKDNWRAFERDGLEADDLVVIIRNETPNSFIVSTDKDILYCIEGTHYSARFGKSEFININKREADYNFAKSLLIGDKIDGIPNIKYGFGEKSAEKVLMEAKEEDLRETCLNLFKEFYGETEGLFRFMTQINLLYIIHKMEELPENLKFEIPKFNCYDCIEDILSEDIFKTS